MSKINFKKIQFFLVIITAFVLFASFYFQYVEGMQPCPLCLMQRLCVFLLLVLLGLSLGTMRKAHWVSLIQVVIASGGLFFSLRQLWLQSLPAESAPACMPGLDVLVRYFPWQTVAHALFWGAGDCAEKSWVFLGVPMAGWSALYFLVMLVMGVFLYSRTRSFR
ncbi:MAG TPA: disulfide bond formation protein B [Legionella sp.]|nr:disulfide bond formation protein B [Legionella sp.]